MLTLGTGVGFNGKRVGGGPPFVVSDTPNTLIWLGSYDPASATLHTQPTSIDARGTFDSSTGWSVGAGWTIANGVATFNKASSGSIQATSVSCIEKCRYSITFDVARRTAGTVQARFGGYLTGSFQSAVGSYTEEGTASATTAPLFIIGSEGGDLDIDNVRSFVNRNIRYYTPKYRASGLTGVFSEPTADYMPWWQEDGSFRLDIVRGLVWGGALSDFKCLTDGSGGTVILCFKSSSTTMNALLYMAGYSAGSVGLRLDLTATTATLRVANGSGTYALDASITATTAANTVYVLTMRIASGTDGVTFRQNKVTKYTGTVNSPSAANPSAALIFQGSATTNSTTHAYDLYAANRVLSDAEVEAIENDMYFRATGGTL